MRASPLQESFREYSINHRRRGIPHSRRRAVGDRVSPWAALQLPEPRWRKRYTSPTNIGGYLWSAIVALAPTPANPANRYFSGLLLPPWPLTLTPGAPTGQCVGVTNDSADGSDPPGVPADLIQARLAELEENARVAVNQLAAQDDPEAFQALLRLSSLVGESLGVSARMLATTGSWAKVAEVAGTSRQAAWSRWSS